MCSSGNVLELETPGKEQNSSIPRIKLNDGNLMPMLAYGLGTANLREQGTPINYKTVEVTIKAIKAGFRHLDGAEVYGNEEELGLAIKFSGVPREELYVVTKFFDFCRSPKESFQSSLKRLDLDYVDLYLIHAPFFARSDIKLQEVWADFEDIKRSGRARSIGVSNFSQAHLEVILKTATIPPAINQIEFHPYLQQHALLDFQRKHGIAVAAYGTLFPLTRKSGDLVSRIWGKLAEKYSVTESVIGLRWPMDQGVIVVTTTCKEERMEGVFSGLSTLSLLQQEVNMVAEAGKLRTFRAYWDENYPGDANH
ncbi:putative aldo/keto reductase [Colletotrichum sublineola]|uniref:Putative aldo/keto reductase n=1 Tax=Colletotrichum sublineola TaxID=1173701 RepID=A0A066WV56_COLSU|nr:putative aldo/keto reductase [Colletotrichum sublineola]